jgi:hypothetical protein
MTDLLIVIDLHMIRDTDAVVPAIARYFSAVAR